MSRIACPVVSAMAGLCGLMLFAGCLSDNPGSSSLAYVNVDAQAIEPVEAETVRVFKDDGYALVDKSSGEFVFEREATQRDRVFFGYYGDTTLVMRVVVTIQPANRGGFLVRADAFAMHDGSDSPVSRLARRPYQDLLNRVKANMVTSGGAER